MHARRISGAARRSDDCLLGGILSLEPVAIDLGAPVVVAIVCLVLANRLRYFGRQHFVQRLAELQVSPAGSTLFPRAFRDDQMRIRRASRNLFSSVFDLGRMPATLDELMLERLDGRGDLIAIGNPQDRKGAARRSPLGAQRLYVDDAHWQETVTMLARDADRIVLCVDASDGGRCAAKRSRQQDAVLPQSLEHTAVDGGLWRFRHRSRNCRCRPYPGAPRDFA
jgi:hypothetical protein